MTRKYYKYYEVNIYYFHFLNSFRPYRLNVDFSCSQAINYNLFLTIRAIMCCCDEHETRTGFPQREKMCRKFIITDQEDLTRTFYVNISQFETANQEIALCRILLHLTSKGLTTNDRKFYMPKFNSIIEPKTFCRIKIYSLNQRDVVLKSYPKEKDNNQIFKENLQFEPIVLFQPKSFKPVATSGFQLFNMAEQKFNMNQTFNSNLDEGADCPCMISNTCLKDACNVCVGKDICEGCQSSPEESSELKPLSPSAKKQTNDQIENSLLYLKRQIKNQTLETGLKQQESDKCSDGEPMKEEHIESKSKGQSSEAKISTQEGKGKKGKSPTKRTREPHRNISEVIVMTKLWRTLHEKKSWSLIEAAKLVGISKKSLDDYFLILRQGVIHGYDFAGNLTHGMGELRSFIREKESKVSGKLHKSVECFSLVPDFNLDLLIEQYKNGEGLNFLA